jgi:hypothetical protein
MGNTWGYSCQVESMKHNSSTSPSDMLNVKGCVVRMDLEVVAVELNEANITMPPNYVDGGISAPSFHNHYEC